MSASPWAAVRAAAERYAGVVRDVCPGADGPDVPAADAPPAAWARFRVHWPFWRPHWYTARALGIDPAALSELADECRAAGRGRAAQLGAALTGGTGDLLARCAGALGAIAAAARERTDAQGRLADAGRAVDGALDAIPAHDPAVRLARALRGAELWPAVPFDAPREFLPALFAALSELVEQGCLTPELASDVVREVAGEWGATGPPPAWAELLAGLERRAADGGPAAIDLGELPPGVRDGLRSAFDTDRVPAAAWLAWSRTPAGADWVHAAVTGGDERAAGWVARAAVTAGAWLAPTPRGAGWEWPSRVPATQSGVRFTTADAPAGMVVRVDRCATDPTLAAAVLSLGPAPDPVALAAAGVWKAVAEWPAGTAAAAGAVAAGLGGRAPGAADLLPVLDALVTPDAPAQAAEAVREWAAAAGLYLLPDEGGGGYGVDERPAFRAAEPAGAVVRVRGYGLADESGAVLRPAVLTVSAGPPPAGLRELEQAAAAAPADICPAVEAALMGWRPAGRAGELAAAAAEFFERFWGEWHPAWMAVDPTGAVDAAGRLAGVVRGLGFTVFEPAHLQDHPPRWVRLPPGQRPETGRVVRVVAPGLVDAAGNLRVAAVVEAE